MDSTDILNTEEMNEDKVFDENIRPSRKCKYKESKG